MTLNNNVCFDLAKGIYGIQFNLNEDRDIAMNIVQKYSNTGLEFSENKVNQAHFFGNQLPIKLLKRNAN